MGRRHFHFAPAVRDHLSEGACRVVSGGADLWPHHFNRRHVPPPPDAWCEEPHTPTKRQFGRRLHESSMYEAASEVPGRRMFLGWEASENGATKDFTSFIKLRRSNAASITLRIERGERRHYSQDMGGAATSSEESTHSKRHIGSATHSHLSDGDMQVLYGDAPPSGRRHCVEIGGRPASAGAERRGLLPHQRRHLASEDHMFGATPSACSQGEVPLCGSSKGRRSASNPPGGVATLLRSEASPWIPPGKRTSSPSRRPLSPKDHLFGGRQCFSSGPDTPEPFFTRRHHRDPCDSMLGGSLRLPFERERETSFVSSSGRPEDHLFGSVWRPTSAPATARRDPWR